MEHLCALNLCFEDCKSENYFSHPKKFSLEIKRGGICKKPLTWLFCASGRHLFYDEGIKEGNGKMMSIFAQHAICRVGKNFKLFHELYEAKKEETLSDTEATFSSRFTTLNMRRTWRVWEGRIGTVFSLLFPCSSKKKFIYFSGKLDFFGIAADRNFRARMLIAITHFYARDNDDSVNVLVCILLPILPPEEKHCMQTQTCAVGSKNSDD